MKTKQFDKYSKKHHPWCAYKVFSGDRHCSCGRDEAIKEVEVLKTVIAILIGVG